MPIAYFDRFTLEIPDAAVPDCSHGGACDADVARWSPRISRPETITPAILAAELKEYGAWDTEELADDDSNWQRIIWIACCDLKERGDANDDHIDTAIRSIIKRLPPAP